MLDGKADRLPDALKHELASDAVAPRLPNAAAWLQELSALEAEFETILNQRTSSPTPAVRHSQS
jgi:hypothetical protein